MRPIPLTYYSSSSSSISGGEISRRRGGDYRGGGGGFCTGEKILCGVKCANNNYNFNKKYLFNISINSLWLWGCCWFLKILMLVNLLGATGGGPGGEGGGGGFFQNGVKGILFEESAGPRFLDDWPTTYSFSSRMGGKLSCRVTTTGQQQQQHHSSDGSGLAGGSSQNKPQISWLVSGTGKKSSSKDFLPLNNNLTANTNAAFREVDGDGNLVFKPFDWHTGFRPQLHAISYRCKATNPVGTILSPEIHVRPWPEVLDAPFQIENNDVMVLKGNIARLRCSVPADLKDFVTVTSWVQDGTVNIYPNFQTGKYLMLPNGDLFVFNVEVADGYKTFSCRTSFKLTNQAQNSPTARIIVREVDSTSLEPLTLSTSASSSSASAGGEIGGGGGGVTRLTANAGDDVFLTCFIGQGSHPPPSYSWYRERDGLLTELSMAGRGRSSIGGGIGGGGVNSGGMGGGVGGFSTVPGPFPVLTSVEPSDSGEYVCRVNNSISSLDIRIHLTVYAPLRVQISPAGSQMVDVGRLASFRCLVSGSPISAIEWFKDGVAIRHDSASIHRYKISSREVLTVTSVEAEDAGMFQCFASNDLYSAQDSVQLRLGSVLPELTYRFSEQTLQVGPYASIKCIAVGNPPPQFQWTLDGFSIPENERFLVGQYVTVHDNVISHVNITSVHAEDGGLYSCHATNVMGTVSHSSRLNIYGPPLIRRIQKPIKAVSGKNFQISCPVSGYPIELITWEKGGKLLPVNRQQRVYPNGTLIIENIQRETDEGIYSCSAKGRAGLTSARDLHIQVVVPPKIMPFQFLSEYLREGRRLAVSCQILEGDKPLEFTWLFEGKIISPSTSTGVTVRIPDEYSSTLVIDSLTSGHNGQWTCVAENSAGKELHSAILTVNVPAKWTIEPRDINVSAGQQVNLQCQAEGHPTPSITWKRASSSQPGEYKDVMGKSTTVFDNGTIRFEEVKKADEGQYLCEAKNQVGSGLSKVIMLKVHAPAEFLIREEEISVKAGDKAVLQCRATGDLPIDIQWFHGNKHSKITSHSTNRYTVRYQNLDDAILSELLISGAGRADGGGYKCRASNSFGSDQTTVTLKIQEPPEQPLNLRLVEEQSRSIQISWSESFNGNSPLINFIIQRKFTSETWTEADVELAVPATQTTAVIPGLSPATTYHIRVVAQNGLGFSRPSEIVQVTTEQEAPEGPPQEVQVESLTSTKLRVTWSPPEKRLQNGAILGYYLGYREIGLALLSSPSSSNSGSGSSGSSSSVMKGGAAGSGGSGGGGGGGDPAKSSGGSSNSAGFFSSASHPMTSGDMHGYHFKTVEVGPGQGGTGTLDNLKKYSHYAVVVQTFNSKGAGPVSPPVLGTTEQDVPSMPPSKVACLASSSESIQVTWDEPPMEGQHGVIQGYKVMHQVANRDDSEDDNYAILQPSGSGGRHRGGEEMANLVQDSSAAAADGGQQGGGEEDEEGFPVVTKMTTSKSTGLHQLKRWTNYTVSVLSFTTMGDGVASEPILCQTDEDVPTAPYGIKAVVSSRRSVLLSWLPPYSPNGNLEKFTLYMRTVHDSSKIEKRTLDGDERSYEAIGLKEGQLYEFWLTASTRIGEGSPTEKVQLSPSNKVPAKIASFSQTIQVPWKREILLRCDSVGIPEPSITWHFNGKNYADSSFTNSEQVKLGSGVETLKLSQVAPEQGGNYSCTVTNVLGSDTITYEVKVLVPPVVKLETMETSYDSIQLSWSTLENPSPIKGFVINYKREPSGDWEEYKLVKSGRLPTHNLQGLICGSKYQVFITAFNKIGTGKPSEIFHGRTKGSIPVLPKKEDFLSSNASTVVINLDSWRDLNCPIYRFDVEYKPAGGDNKWHRVPDLPGDTKSHVLHSLQPNTKYDVRVTATNNAGHARGDFTIFTTAGHHLMGSILPESDDLDDSASSSHQMNTSLLIVFPSILSLIAITGVIGVLCYFRRKRLGGGPKTIIGIGDSPGGLLLMQSQNRQMSREQHYCVVKTAPHHPNDPSLHHHHAALSAGHNLDPNTNTIGRYKTNDSTGGGGGGGGVGGGGNGNGDYNDDVCPYATFQLPDKAPSRPLITKGLGGVGGGGGGGGGNTSTISSTKKFGRHHTGDTMHYNFGNIYSGPYHSVQSPGFIYNDARLPYNCQSTLPLRDSSADEYCKVDGGRITDSDNNLGGSTDSEVKKILTLHLPISSYDTLEDSDGCGGETKKQPNIHQCPTGPGQQQQQQQLQLQQLQRAMAASHHEMVTFRQRQRQVSDPAITSDHSSTSSEDSTSPAGSGGAGGMGGMGDRDRDGRGGGGGGGGGGRKKYFSSRKTKSKSSVQSGSSSMKQRVRSSSGYSSHTEETSFRIQPPSRFSDSRELSDGGGGGGFNTADGGQQLIDMMMVDDDLDLHDPPSSLLASTPTGVGVGVGIGGAVPNIDPRIGVGGGSMKRSHKNKVPRHHSNRKSGGATYHIDV